MRLSLGQAAEVRLGRQRAPQYEQGDHVIPYLRSANVTDGALDLRDVKQMNFTPLEQTIFGLEEGDVLLTEGSGSRDTVGTSAVWRNEIDAPVCFQNTLLRLRPRTGVTEGSFLEWWARHARSSGQIAAVSTGANILHIGSDGLKRLTMQVPAVDEQRRIADFLDDRVSRVDRIIAARREQTSHSREAFDAWWDSSMRQLGQQNGVIPLRRVLTSIADGPFGSSLTSQHYADSGTRVIRLGNIGVAVFRNDDHAFIPDEYAATLANHAALAGDLVMAGLGDDRWPLGRCAVVPEIGPAIVKADCYRIRLQPTVSHEFAAIALSSPHVRSRLAMRGRGATRARLNTEVAREAPMVLLPPAEQKSYISEWNGRRDEVEELQQGLNDSVDLLTEYKSSLITAAVTGELDVSTAGSNIPG